MLIQVHFLWAIQDRLLFKSPSCTHIPYEMPQRHPCGDTTPAPRVPQRYGETLTLHGAACTAESPVGKAFRLNIESSTFSAMTEKSYKAIQIFMFYRYLEKCLYILIKFL